MTDALLRHGPDGGELTVEAGLVLMSEGLETAAYLSLFGGNDDDDGSAAGERAQWWGNIDEVLPERTYRSETQNLIVGLPAVPSNLRRLEQAAGRDLAWMLAAGVAVSVTATASIPAVGRVALALVIITPTRRLELTFG